MTCIGEHDIADRDESIRKWQHRSNSQWCVSSRLLNANGNHADQDRRENGDERCDRHPRNILQRSRQVEDEEDYQSYDSPDYGAGSTIGDGIEADCPCQNVTGHGEDQEDRLCSAEELSTDGAHLERLEENLSSICE